MKINFMSKAVLLSLAVYLGCFTSLAWAAEADTAVDACALPAKPAATQEETAWRIFVAINCKVKNNQLTWETWKSQACLNNPADCPTQRLHGSALRTANVAATPDSPKRTGGCAPMTTSATASESGLENFVPKNLSASPVFCEEVTISPAEEAYGKSKGLLTVAGQKTYLQAGSVIDFPTGAIEVKADWVPASSFTDVTFDCTKPNKTHYQEIIDGQCYALVGIHISSKLYPNWLWATFEPQDKRTNPNRCNPSLYNACLDPWGSKPAKSTGAKTKTTPKLQALFKAAGSKLDKSFQNYRLVGTQTQYNQPTASNGNLGNSFVEFNAQVSPYQASCITCHSYAQRNAAGKTPPGGPLPGANSVGLPTPLPEGYKPLDFSWFLGFGVPQK
jgi:hypothetical protein